MDELVKVIALTIFVCVFIIHEAQESAEQDIEEVRELNRMLLRFKSNAETVSVVRCEDCRYWRKADTEASDRKWCYAHANYFTPDFFCAYGERKTDA